MCNTHMGPKAQTLYNSYPQLYVLIDTIKMMGFNVYEAWSQFSLWALREVSSGRLEISQQDLQLFFLEAWADPFVHLMPNDAMKQYTNSEVNLFTPSRVEFGLFEDGFLDTKTQADLLRKYPDLEDFQNFIISCNLPSIFYVNIALRDVTDVLTNGTQGRVELYQTAWQAEDERQKDQVTLLVEPEGVQLKQLYTDTLTGSGCGSRRHCIYYDLPIPRKSIKPVEHHAQTQYQP